MDFIAIINWDNIICSFSLQKETSPVSREWLSFSLSEVFVSMVGSNPTPFVILILIPSVAE